MERRKYLAPAETWRTGLSVPALTSANVHQAVLYLVHEALGPGKWGQWDDNAFEWIPYRTRHRIDILDTHDIDGSSVTLLRSDFTLGGFEDAMRGVTTANLVNQMSPSTSCWFDVESQQLHLTTSVTVDVVEWWLTDIFVLTVPRLVAFAEALDQRLAGVDPEYVPASFRHEELGIREEPDQLVSEWWHDKGEPEASAGMWFSDEEIRRFTGTMTLSDATANGLDPDELSELQRDYNRLSMDEMTYTYLLPEEPGGNGVARVHFGSALHPELGYGFNRLISLPFFSEETQLPPPMYSSEGASIANYLNQFAFELPVGSMGLGTWVVWGDQLHHVTFFLPQIMRVLAANAQGRIGDIFSTFVSPRAVRVLLKTMFHIANTAGIGPSRFAEDEWNWRGIEQNAFKWSLWVDREAATSELFESVPLNQLLDEPLEVEASHPLYNFRCDQVLASYGIFNPMGPSVGSLEVMIDYTAQRGILVDRTRHFLGPSMDVHAIVDQDGFNQICELAGSVMERLEWGSFEWCEIRVEDPDDRNSLLGGLYNFLRRVIPDAGDVRSEIRGLVGSVHNPWLRLTDREFPEVETSEDPWMDLVATVTLPPSVDTHNAFIRSAWEGARAFYEGGEDAAEAANIAQSRMMWEVGVRRGDIDPRG